ncbi:MAG: DUF1804 family protein [Gallionella sp.]
MAHDKATRRAVRASYVFDHLSYKDIAAKHGVSINTLRIWKNADKEQGDDWSKARITQGSSIEDVARQTLIAVVHQVQATMLDMQENPDLSPQEKVKLLGNLADAYKKLISASKYMMPETDKFAVAGDVVKRLSEFILTRYPKHARAFLEVLEPFGEELATAYG